MRVLALLLGAADEDTKGNLVPMSHSRWVIQLRCAAGHIWACPAEFRWDGAALTASDVVMHCPECGKEYCEGRGLMESQRTILDGWSGKLETPWHRLQRRPTTHGWD